MSQLQIQQQDARALAAGYSKSFRRVEIGSIIAFWTLSAIITWKALHLWSSYKWLIMAAFFVGFILADFVSGFVHWMADTWGSADMPVLGKTLVRPFREHHVDQKAMTRHDYIETNGANCLVSVPVAAMCTLIPLGIEGWVGPALFLMVSMGSMIFWVMMTNQFHKWSHLEPSELPAIVRWAQRSHLILPVDHHQRHHTAPFDTYYCITNGWLNYPLARLGFFRFAERVVMATLGLIPRKDDIGLVAALKIAPVVAGADSKSPVSQA